MERMHQSISTMIAISLKENPPTKYEDVSNLIHRKCMAVQYAMGATVHSTLKYSPGELTFHRDMIQPFPSKIDWKQIVETKQINVNKENAKENSIRTEFEYKVGQKVLIQNKNQFKSKLDPTVLNEGPLTIQRVHTDGTV